MTTPNLASGQMWTSAVAAARAEMEIYGPVTTGHPESLWDETSDMPESVVRAVANVYLPALASVAVERDGALRKLADAPHDSLCNYHSIHGPSECSCWKSGL
jgi:hypothetical protein